MFTLSYEYAKACRADLLLATDPDCDRVSIAVRNKAGEYELLTGNRPEYCCWIIFAASAKSTDECRIIL